MRVVLCVLLAASVARSAGAETVATGVVRAADTVVVRSEVAGIVSAIAVKEGQLVRAGDLLIQLHSERQEIGIRLAEARLARARAALDASQVMLKNARQEDARIQKAAAALPRKELEDIADEVTRLDASLKAQEADLEQARVELDLRKQELQDTRVVAPFNGTVTSILVHKGDSLRPLETQILELVNLDSLYVETVLPVEEVLRVQVGRQVRLVIEEGVLGQSAVFDCVVTYVNPTVDASSRTFAVKIAVSDRSRRVRPGMRAQVHLP